MATRSIVRFRRTLLDIGQKLTADEVKKLAFIYDIPGWETLDNSIDLLDRMLKCDKLRGCQEDLLELEESLEIIGRADLKKIVSKYIEQRARPLSRDLSDSEPIIQEATHFATEEVGGDANYCLGGFRKRAVCDSSSDSSSSDNTGSCAGTDDITPEDDKNFMKKAQDFAKRSGDNNTKIGAIIVDRKSKKIIGEGWNRLPKNCEDRFKWSRDEGEPFEYSKHLYVLYGVQAAILYALDKKADLRDAILYTTLYPSNNCAKIIRETGISEVVYDDDKFYDRDFMKASRKILEGIKCRHYRVH